MTESHTTTETLEVPVWVKRGPMLIRRDALEWHDPDQTYNYIKRTYGVDPEDFGIEKPQPDGRCPCCEQMVTHEQD